ncbi:MAG: M48 family peptidase [Gammaproteobacteria bacterium]|nr:MAG: M48 family peptidase [Gammaproteobacteria bacterium]
MSELFIYAFLVFFVVSLSVRLYLNYRQKLSVATHKNSVPIEFSDKINLKDHQKAADYTTTKLKFSNFEIVFDAIVLLFWTLGGGLSYLYSVVMMWNISSPILSGLTIIGLFVAINMLIGLPFSWYNTFVIEERYKFNRTTYGTFFIDIIKGLGLGILIGAPLLWVILYLMGMAGNLWWLWAFFVYAGFSLVLMWVYPTIIAPIFNKFKLLDDDILINSINNLLKKCGFKSKGIYIMDGSKRSGHGNAYFSGFGKNKRIVFFDTLLKTLNTQQIEAVLAHELGHFKHKHILKSIIMSMAFSLIGLAILGFIYNKLWFFQSFAIPSIDNAMALLLFSLIMPVFTFLLSPVFSYLSRKNEYQADDYAADKTDANDLVDALVQMYKENASTLTPDSLYSSFYNSHPPASLRIKNLRRTSI